MFAEWCRTCDIPTTSGTAYTRFISQLQQKGFLKGDDITDWFLRSFMVVFSFFLATIYCISSMVCRHGHADTGKI